MHFVFHPLGTGDGPELRQLLAICHKAFPVWERRPDSLLCEHLRSGFSKAFIARTGRRVISFINFYPVPESRLIFLDYAANRDGRRKRVAHFRSLGFQYLQNVPYISTYP